MRPGPGATRHMQSRTYRGAADGRVTVEIAGVTKPLPPRHDLRNHSPDGFAWGYHGSGPAQLALAILADATGEDAIALSLYQRFKLKVVATWPMDTPWQLDSEAVSEWLEKDAREVTR